MVLFWAAATRNGGDADADWHNTHELANRLLAAFVRCIDACRLEETAKPLAHTFDVEIAATHGTADPRSVLNDARIRLFNPALEDVSHLLHAGTKTLRKTAAGRHVVRWAR